MLPITTSSLLFVLSLLTQTTAHRNLPRQPHQHQHQNRHHELEERLPITGTTTVVVQMTQTHTVWVKPTNQVAFDNGGNGASTSVPATEVGSTFSSSTLIAGSTSSTLAVGPSASQLSSSAVSSTNTASLSSSSAVYSYSSNLSSTTSLGVNNIASPSSSSQTASSTTHSSSVVSSSSTISNASTPTTLGVAIVAPSTSSFPSVPSQSSLSSLSSTGKSSSSASASLTVAGISSSSSISSSASKSVTITTSSSSSASTQTPSSSTTSHFSSTTSALTVDRVSSSSVSSINLANATLASVTPSTASAFVSKTMSSSAASTSEKVSSSSPSIKTSLSSSITSSASASRNATTTSTLTSSSSIFSSTTASKNASSTSLRPSSSSSTATITASASHNATSPTTTPATSATSKAVSSLSASKNATSTTISSSTSMSSTTSSSTTSSASATSTLEVLGSTLMNAYYPDWSGSYLTPEDVDWSKYDVIDFAFAIPTSDWNLEFTQDDSADLLNRLVATGHAAGKRVKLSIGGWTGSQYFSTICASSSNRKTFVANILAAYNLYNVDGIDIDWEYPGTTGADGNAVSSSDSANFLKFLTELRAALPTGALISTATQVWPFADSNGSPMTDVSGFAAVIDWILIMNYDVWGSSTTPGANAPLSDGCGNSSQPLANAYAAVSSWTSAGMPANQITLGVPAYGYLQKSTATSLKDRRSYPTLPHKKAGLSRSSSSVTVYNGDGGSSDGQVMFESLISQGALTLSGGSYIGAGGFTREWDSCSSTPWLKSTASGQIITYDDPQSMSLKGQFAAQVGLRGCNVFSIDGDWTGSSWPLTDSVRSGLGL